MMKLNQDYPSNVGAAGNGDDRYLVVKYSRGYQVLHEDEPVAIIHNEVAYYDQPSMKRRIPTRVFDGPRSTRSGDQILQAGQVPLGGDAPHQSDRQAERGPLPGRTSTPQGSGEAMALRAEKQPVKNKGTSLAIFNSEGYIVARRAPTSGGATLLTVASEYRGKGLGKLIGHYWYEYNPRIHVQEASDGGWGTERNRTVERPGPGVQLTRLVFRAHPSRGYLGRQGEADPFRRSGSTPLPESAPSSEPKTKIGSPGCSRMTSPSWSTTVPSSTSRSRTRSTSTGSGSSGTLPWGRSSTASNTTDPSRI